MKSKTLQLIDTYTRLIKEQGEDPNMEQDPNAPQDVQNVVDPNAPPAQTEEEMPLTSQAENQYISDLIDAALFEPSSEDARTLLNLQNVMQMKRFTNAREEVLPMVLSLIRTETSGGDIKKDLSSI